MDFVAIDFETANRFWNSACEIGLVVVEDGRVVDTYRRLIRPTPNQFDRGNIRVHNITPEMVHDAPTFADIYEEILPYLADRHIVAHNASFDIGVLRATSRLYSLPEPSLTYSCTVQLARKVWPEAPRHGLGIISQYLGIELEHHQALSDANACAQIMLQAQQLYGARDVESLLSEFNMRPRSIRDFGHSSRQKRQVLGLPARSAISIATPAPAPRERTQVHNWPSHPRIKDITFDASKAQPKHPAYGKSFVFTGELSDCSREQAQRMVLEAGGKCSANVNRSTHFLVQGIQTWRAVTSKTLKAFEYRDEGSGIELIDEAAFFEMFSAESED